jgi:hypothetical protein
MPNRTPPELEAEAVTWTRADLLVRWEQIKARTPIPGWSRGKAFEYLVIQAFRLESAAVRWPYSVTYPHRLGTTEQIDGAVYFGERAFLIESKDLSERATIGAVAKLRFRIEGRPPGTMGVLFSVRNFTFPTELFTQFAAPLNVLLWSREDLDHALATGSMVAGLEMKLRLATEWGLALYPLGDAR